ncbi:putative lumazine-binding protein [Aquimarina sp. MAR_2010_214]|uniref:nuclear transport factor 2 family protein n=1 Tax=Aquimarina sp. MAR_2010_214 TaxID=1250026 RepID=UPI000C70B7EE|nr:nuclear transport factor 2 family protein [Aquimarina sp. MAR_2010_214]PKV50030.1 putative lumazine-binding protein [Aquimarina sp. MAR_2010_214]
MNRNIIFIISLLTIGHLFSQQKNTIEKYYRHLRYNHVSPHVKIKGIHEIDHQEAKRTSHYVFRYNKKDQLIEVINFHYHDQRRHPLATIGAHRTVFDYANGVETRIFYDKKGNRMINDREVYKEVYQYDKNGFVNALDFYDLDNNPMESNWKIANYRWVKHKKLIIEKRYNLQNDLVDISPYFEFSITGILYRKDGSPKANYNLNEKLEIQENSIGIASYEDTYDEKGNHIKYSYHNAKGELTKNQWNFAANTQEFDSNGYLIKGAMFDENNELIHKRDFPSVTRIRMAKPASKKDTIEIREKSLGYLIALQELKPDLMKEVFHEDLAKRTMGFDQEKEKEVIRETTYKEMIEYAKSWNKTGTRFPPNPSNEIKILDIYNRIATVKLISDNWVEYLHLIRTNGEWDIINLLWQHKNIDRYPK